MTLQYAIQFGGQPGAVAHQVEVTILGEGRYRVVIDGLDSDSELQAYRVTPTATAAASTWLLRQDGGGAQHLVDVEGMVPDLRLTLSGRAGSDTVAVKVTDARAAVLSAPESGRAAQSGPQVVRAPMPGKVVKVLCSAGAQVKSGQGLLIIEAMKMENELRAPADGVVQQVLVTEGQTVEGGMVLVALVG